MADTRLNARGSGRQVPLALQYLIDDLESVRRYNDKAAYLRQRTKCHAIWNRDVLRRVSWRFGALIRRLDETYESGEAGRNGRKSGTVSGGRSMNSLTGSTANSSRTRRGCGFGP